MTSQMPARRPLLFSALVTLIFLILLVMVVAAQKAADRPFVQEAIGAAGRALVGVVALFGLAALGWRRWLAGGGSASSWLLIVLPLLYILVVFPLLFTGTYAIPRHDASLVSMVAANGFMAGVMEELVFRGLVLGSLLRGWAHSRGGLWRALVVSSVFFAVPHALNLLAGADPLRTLAQLVWALLLGVVFGALTVAGGSVWPAGILHGLGNAFIHANRLGHGAATDPTVAALLAIAPLPLNLYAWLVLRHFRQLRPSPDSSSERTPPP